MFCLGKATVENDRLAAIGGEIDQPDFGPGGEPELRNRRRSEPCGAVGGTVVEHQHLERSWIILRRHRLQRVGNRRFFLISGDQDRHPRIGRQAMPLRPPVEEQADDQERIHEARNISDEGDREEREQGIGKIAQRHHPRARDNDAEHQPRKCRDQRNPEFGRNRKIQSSPYAHRRVRQSSHPEKCPARRWFEHITYWRSGLTTTKAVIHNGSIARQKQT